MPSESHVKLRCRRPQISPVAGQRDFERGDDDWSRRCDESLAGRVADEPEPNGRCREPGNLGGSCRQPRLPAVEPERLAGQPERDGCVAGRPSRLYGIDEGDEMEPGDQARRLECKPAADTLRTSAVICGELAGGQPVVDRDNPSLPVGRAGLAVRMSLAGRASLAGRIVGSDQCNEIRACEPCQEVDPDQALEGIAAADNAIRDQRLESMGQRVCTRREARVGQLQQPQQRQIVAGLSR